MGNPESKAVADRVREIVLEDFRGPPETLASASKPLWAQMRRCGSELWLDTGDVDDISSLWCDQFTALTTNNTLLNKEVQKGIYDDLVRKVAGQLKDEAPEEDLVLEIAFVLNAYHGLLLTRRFGAMVSVELHTDLANDVERTVHYGRRYHEISPDGFYVKVPLTTAGLLAARRLGQEDIPVNFTLGFSARQNYLIAAVARPAFVNVFLGRLNAFVAEHKLGSGKLVGEKATLASQQIITELREKLGVPTRQIAASLREGPQVRTLAGVDVLTIPPKVAREFEELDPAPETISSQLGAQFEIDLAPEVNSQALGINALWDVPEEFRSAVHALLKEDLSCISPNEVGAFFAQRDLADFLPQWSDAEIETIRADGKIPVYDTWKDKFAARQVGLDALVSASGLHSFAADQAAMDGRIRSLL